MLDRPDPLSRDRVPRRDERDAERDGPRPPRRRRPRREHERGVPHEPRHERPNPFLVARPLGDEPSPARGTKRRARATVRILARASSPNPNPNPNPNRPPPPPPRSSSSVSERRVFPKAAAATVTAESASAYTAAGAAAPPPHARVALAHVVCAAALSATPVVNANALASMSVASRARPSSPVEVATTRGEPRAPRRAITTPTRATTSTRVSTPTARRRLLIRGATRVVPKIAVFAEIFIRGFVVAIVERPRTESGPRGPRDESAAKEDGDDRRRPSRELRAGVCRAVSRVSVGDEERASRRAYPRHGEDPLATRAYPVVRGGGDFVPGEHGGDVFRGYGLGVFGDDAEQAAEWASSASTGPDDEGEEEGEGEDARELLRERLGGEGPEKRHRPRPHGDVGEGGGDAAEDGDTEPVADGVGERGGGAAARARPATALARRVGSVGSDSRRTRAATAQRTTATLTEETTAVYVHTQTSLKPWN